MTVPGRRVTFPRKDVQTGFRSTWNPSSSAPGWQCSLFSRPPALTLLPLGPRFFFSSCLLSPLCTFAYAVPSARSLSPSQFIPAHPLATSLNSTSSPGNFPTTSPSSQSGWGAPDWCLHVPLTSPITALTPAIVCSVSQVSTGHSSLNTRNVSVLTTFVFPDRVSSPAEWMLVEWTNYIVRTCSQEYNFILSWQVTEPHLTNFKVLTFWL